ncbi:hypothetical protein BDZ45DRAFT_177313 [Acephala macrosclerotiorum]|nr:hypothetical protein BDZ45DRAFT_177313 [Acephala macrosclerotiorum]
MILHASCTTLDDILSPRSCFSGFLQSLLLLWSPSALGRTFFLSRILSLWPSSIIGARFLLFEETICVQESHPSSDHFTSSSFHGPFDFRHLSPAVRQSDSFSVHFIHSATLSNRRRHISHSSEGGTETRLLSKSSHNSRASTSSEYRSANVTFSSKNSTSACTFPSCILLTDKSFFRSFRNISKSGCTFMLVSPQID